MGIGTLDTPESPAGETTGLADYNLGHPSTQEIGKNVRFLSVHEAKDVHGATSASALNSHEVEFLKSHGYLIKRGLLDSHSASFEKAIETMWNKVPGSVLRKDAPDRWTSEVSEHWTENDRVQVGSMIGSNWKMRSRGIDGIGTEDFLVDDIANHHKMLKLASAFLGSPIRPVRRVRGIYSVFPHEADTGRHLYPHGDYMASQLSAMVLLGDVRVGCGGFTVWPGSHHRMHLCWDKVAGTDISGERVERYARVRDQLLQEIEPVEFTGHAGDVIFWHPRLIHSAGINDSGQSDRPLVRVLTPIDYQRAGETYVDDLEFGPGPKYQWWIDTRNVLEDVPATESNIWHGWGID